MLIILLRQNCLFSFVVVSWSISISLLNKQYSSSSVKDTLLEIVLTIFHNDIFSDIYSSYDNEIDRTLSSQNTQEHGH